MRVPYLHKKVRYTTHVTIGFFHRASQTPATPGYLIQPVQMPRKKRKKPVRAKRRRGAIPNLGMVAAVTGLMGISLISTRSSGIRAPNMNEKQPLSRAS